MIRVLAYALPALLLLPLSACSDEPGSSAQDPGAAAPAPPAAPSKTLARSGGGRSSAPRPSAPAGRAGPGSPAARPPAKTQRPAEEPFEGTDDIDDPRAADRPLPPVAPR